MSEPLDVQVVGPLGRAWDITLTILTRPFRAWVWVSMGVLIFLTTLGEYVWITPSKHVGAILGMASGSEDMIWGMVVRGAVFAVAVVVCVFGVWLRSRSLFCLYHSIAQGEPAIQSGATKYAREGDNYFRWSLVYVLLVLVIFAVVKFLGWVFSLAGEDSQSAWLAGFITGIYFLAVAFTGMVLESIVAPVMYLKRRTAPEALVIAWTMMVRPHLAPIIGVLAIRLGVYVSGMMIFGMLASWGCGVMPLIGTVVFLPVYLLLPVFALTFIDQFRPDFQVVGLHGEGMTCMRCGHDLLATPDVTNCPACGARVAPELSQVEEDPEEHAKSGVIRMTASEFRESMAAPKYDQKPVAIDMDEEGVTGDTDEQEDLKPLLGGAGAAADEKPDAIDLGPEPEKKAEDGKNA